MNLVKLLNAESQINQSILFLIDFYILLNKNIGSKIIFFGN